MRFSWMFLHFIILDWNIYISKNVNKLFSTLNFITSKQIETMGNGKQIINNGTG